MPPSRYARRIGAIGQADAGATFDVQGTLSKVQGAARTAGQVQSAIQQYGSMSTTQQQDAAFAQIVNAWNQVIPGSGSALQTLYDVLPKAGSGPGVCTSDPPAAPLDTSWSHYQHFDSSVGPYPAPPPGSFEAFAYPLLVKNWELSQNCYDSAALAWDALLAALVSGWNATHLGPTRTITRTGLNQWGAKDPIAFAMTMIPQFLTGPAERTAFGSSPTVAPSASLQVNGGALISRPKVVLTVHFGKPALPPAATAHAPAHPSAAATVAGAAVLGALGWTAYALATHRAILPAALRRLAGR